MRSMCSHCHAAADWIDAATTLCPECPEFVPVTSQLVHRSSAVGALAHRRGVAQEIQKQDGKGSSTRG